VVNRCQGKTTARCVAVTAALRSGIIRGMNRIIRLAGYIQGDSRSSGVDDSASMGAVMAVRAFDSRANDRRIGGVIDESAHKGRGVMTIAAIRSGYGAYMTGNLTCCIRSIMAGGARYGMSRQHSVVE